MDLLQPSPPHSTPPPLVLFLVPRWTDRSDSEPQGLPFRSFTVAGAFLHAGYRVLFFDQEHDLDRTDRWGELLSYLPDAVAAFVWMNEMYPHNQSTNTWMMASRLKDSRPDLPVVVGGEFITVCPPRFFDVDTPADYFIRGYGEKSGLALLDCLRTGAEPGTVPGLVWRDAGGQAQHNPPGRQADFAPEYLALYRLVDLRCYQHTGGIFGNDVQTLTIGTGRGCVKGCFFCCWTRHPARILGAEPVVELISFLRERYGVTQYHIGELDFFTSRQRVLRMAGLMAERAPDCHWFALGSPVDLVRLTDAEWEQLARGGLRKVELGSESGSTRLLRAIGKPHEAEDSFLASARMLEHGIVPMNNFLFGFPGETSDDRAATLRLIERIWLLSPERNCMTFRYYQPVWGTTTGEEALDRVEGAPRTVVEFLARRHQYDDDDCRTMPWLSADDERDVKGLVNHYLPLVTSKLQLRNPLQRLVYRGLRQRAARDLRNHRLRGPWDRRLYDRVIGRPLDCTFVP